MEIEQHLLDETHPNPLPSNYRKIELQAPQDLTYLQDNLAKVALDKLNFVLPDNPSRSKPATVISLGGQQEAPNTEAQKEDTTTDLESDPLKEQVRNLISEFLHNTWQSAQENLTLNGLDASSIPVPPTATLSKAPHAQSQPNASSSGPDSKKTEEREGVDFTYTPFDARLQHQLANLHGELERLTAEVSKLRREAPKKAASTFETSLQNNIVADEEAHAQATQTDSNLPPEGLSLANVRQDWSADVQEKYTGAVNQLGTLAGVRSTSSSTAPAAEQNVSGGTNTSRASGVSPDKKEPSLTETMGKALRARDVVHEME